MKFLSKLRRVVATPAALSALASAMGGCDGEADSLRGRVSDPTDVSHATRATAGIQMPVETVCLHIEIWSAEMQAQQPPETQDLEGYVRRSLSERLMDLDNRKLPESVAVCSTRIKESASHLHRSWQEATPVPPSDSRDAVRDALEGNLSLESKAVFRALVPVDGTNAVDAGTPTDRLDRLVSAFDRAVNEISPPLSPKCPEKSPHLESTEDCPLCQVDRLVQSLKDESLWPPSCPERVGTELTRSSSFDGDGSTSCPERLGTAEGKSSGFDRGDGSSPPEAGSSRLLRQPASRGSASLKTKHCVTVNGCARIVNPCPERLGAPDLTSYFQAVERTAGTAILAAREAAGK